MRGGENDDLAISRPIVEIDCIDSSSESWEAQTAPTSLALSCPWRSRPQSRRPRRSRLEGRPGCLGRLPWQNHEEHTQSLRCRSCLLPAKEFWLLGMNA